MKISYAAALLSLLLATSSVAAGSAGQVVVPEGAGHVDMALAQPEGSSHIDMADLSEEEIISGRAASVFGCPRFS